MLNNSQHFLELLKKHSPSLYSLTQNDETYKEFFLNPNKVIPNFEITDNCENNITNLRRNYRYGLMKIALTDLTSENPVDKLPQIASSLANLTILTINNSLKIAQNELQISNDGFAVIAMGKTGAKELNYISDVDLIYIATDELIKNGIAGKIAARISQICYSEINKEASLWEIDLALRPEGKQGATVRTIESTKAYFEKWAVNWEFQALLKASFIAGDQTIGEEYENMARDFIWKAAKRDNFVLDCQKMRQRVIDNIKPDEKRREIKLGEGGLRDVEFTVQLLQLVHGMNDEQIRSKATLDAAIQLKERGYIGRNDAEEISEHYRFLRFVEHRVQLYSMKRTHLFPVDDGEEGTKILFAISSAIGLTKEELCEKFLKTQSLVRGLHLSIYFRPILSILGASDVSLNREQIDERLLSLGFDDPTSANKHIESITSGMSRASLIQQQILPAFLHWLSNSKGNKQYALLTYRKISEKLESSTWFLGLLRDNHFALERLAKVLSSSVLVADLVFENPISIQFLAEDSLLQPQTNEQLSFKFESLINRDMTGLKGIYALEKTRLALSFILKFIDSEHVAKAFGELTDLLIIFTLKQIENGEKMIPLALGRYGSNEMGFASDADLVFVNEDDIEQGDAVKIVSELISKLQEIKIDLELRPEGKLGPISRSIASFTKYYEEFAQIWEFQAMLRARIIKDGNTENRNSILQVTKLKRELTNEELTEIRRIKARVENERGVNLQSSSTNTLTSIDYKLIPGGLTDIEWLVQIKQMMNQQLFASKDSISTLECLDILTPLVFTEEQKDILKSGWIKASVLRNYQALKAVTEDGWQAENEEFLKLARKVRRIFEELF